jgi:hypothetical protein
MNKAIVATLFAALLLLGSNVSAQTTKKNSKVVSKAKSGQAQTTMKPKATPMGENEDAETTGVNPVRSENPDDPLYMNHPYFNGEARWSHADSLYKHGDFPWAMVSGHPDNFRFNPDTGMWEVLNTPNLGTAKPSR